jgi:hypothetical protein
MASERTEAWIECECLVWVSNVRRDLAYQNIIIKGLVFWVVFIELHRRDETESRCPNRSFWLPNQLRCLRVFRFCSTPQEPVFVCSFCLGILSHRCSSKCSTMTHLSPLEAVASNLGFCPYCPLIGRRHRRMGEDALGDLALLLSHWHCFL